MTGNLARGLMTSKRILRGKFRRSLKKVLFCLIVLELFINLLIFIRPRTVNVRKMFHHPDSFKILWIGDSHTRGIGAGDGLSYPEALEQIINSSCPSVCVEVLNSGQAGFDLPTIRQSTEFMLDRLEIQPDLVIIQGGVNTTHSNWDTYRKYLNGKMHPIYQHLPTFLWFLLTKLKTFHLLELFHRDWTVTLLSNESVIEIGSSINEREYGLLVERFLSGGTQPIFLGYAAHTQECLFTAMDKVANQFQVPFLAFSQPETEYFLKKKGWIVEYHPDHRGYRFIAQWVYQLLREMSLECSSCPPLKKTDGPHPDFRYLRPIPKPEE